MPRIGPGEYASRGHHSPNRSVNTSKARCGVPATQRWRTIGAAASAGRGSRVDRGLAPWLRLEEHDPVAEGVDHRDDPAPRPDLDPGVRVRILLGFERELEVVGVGDGHEDAAARARVTVVAAEVDAGVAAGELRVQRLVAAGLVAPVDPEVEVVDVEAQRRGLVEDAQDRHDVAVSRGCRRRGGRSHEGVPVPHAELAGDELERLAVADGDAAVGQCLTEVARHRLGVRIRTWGGHDAVLSGGRWSRCLHC